MTRTSRTLGALAILLGALASGSLAAQSSGSDTPIKVRGGAMTVFTQGTWQTMGKPANKTYCTALAPADVTLVRVERFFDDNEKKHFHRLNLASDTWKIEFRGHKELEAGSTQTREEGMTLQASPLDCAGKRTGKASVTLTRLGAGDFYSKPLLSGGDFKDNRRFKSTCKVDNDRCERIAEIRIFDTDSKKPTYKFHCPDGDCTVLVGRD